MSRRRPPASIARGDEIPVLIATLHDTERRLEELTGGEVDTVTARDGRMLVLRSAQQQMRQVEITKQAAILNALPAHVALLDAQGFIVSLNETWRRFATANAMHDPKKGLGRNYLEICDSAAGQNSSEARLVAAGIRSVLSGREKTWSIEYSCDSPTQQRWFQLTVTPLAADRAGGAVVTHLDVTPRKLAEEVLVESEERFAGAFEYAPIGVALVSPAGRFLRVNRALCDLFGYTESEFLARTVEDITHLDDLEVSRDNIKRALAGEVRSFQIEKRYIHKRGDIITALLSISLVRDAQGHPLYFVSQVQDVTGRRLAENEVRDTNRNFQHLADNITDAFWIRSADMTKVHYVSPAFERIWGRTTDSLYANPLEWSEFIVPEDRERVLAIFSTITRDAPSIDVEYRIWRPDGEIRWVRTRGFQVRDDDGTLIRNTGIVTDITERQRAVAELRKTNQMLSESERRYTDMLGHVEMVSIMLDTNARVTYCNDYMLRLTGWKREEVIGADWFERFVPQTRSDVRQEFARLLAQVPTSWHYENEILTRSGQQRLIQWNNTVMCSANGDVIGTASIGVDVTESRQMEASLQLSSAALRAAGEAILIADRDFKVVSVNPAFTDLTGYTEEEAIGRNPQELLRSDTRDEQFFTGMAARIQRGESWRGEVTNRRKNGSLYLESQTITSVKDADGAIRSFICIKTDLTAQRQMEAQLRQAQKMEAVGQLAAGVAHEFNNLLQALMSMTTIMQLRAPVPEIGGVATEMQSLIKRGAGLTQQLLLFSRHRAIERAEVNIGEQIQKASALLRHIIPATIAIVVETSSELVHVQGDAGQIEQVLLNLAINARDAMPDGGTLTLRTGRVGNDAFLEVEDTGHGMSEITQRHLFEPFFTTKEPGKGTGLGLAVAHGIVHQHGGRIEVESNLEEGSTFRIILPLFAREGIPILERLEETKIAAGAGRLLLVEDDAAVRAGIAALLEFIGYEVTAVSSGEEAIALVLNPPPDVLLSDVTLQGMTGPALAEGMRRRWPELRIVLMSGYVEDATRENAAKQRWHFLQKPFELADLARELQNAMARDMATVN